MRGINTKFYIYIKLQNHHAIVKIAIHIAMELQNVATFILYVDFRSRMEIFTRINEKT